MPSDETTKIASDGLRYKSKEGGSPFGGSSPMSSLSCFKCGLHLNELRKSKRNARKANPRRKKELAAFLV